MDKLYAVESLVLRFRNYGCTNRRFLASTVLGSAIVAFVGFVMGIYPVYLRHRDQIQLIRGLILVGLLATMVVFAVGVSIYIFKRRRDNVPPPKKVQRYPYRRVAQKEFIKTAALAVSMIVIKFLGEEMRGGVGLVVFCVGFYMFLVMLLVVSGGCGDYDVAEGFLAASFLVVYNKYHSHAVIAPFVIVILILGGLKGLLFNGVEELGIGRVEEA